MNSKIDTKSILIGLLAGIAVTLAVRAAYLSNQASNQVGRYQITGAGNHALVIDTVSGQVWQSYMPPMGGSTDADFFKAKIEEKK